MNEYCVVLSTTDSEEEASSLSRQAVELKHAACVQMMPIQSTYFWEGAVEDSKEFLMLFKTTVAAAAGLREFLEKNHSYDVPEIVEIPVSGGGAGYLQWITANTSVS